MITPQVTILIPNYKTLELTKLCLRLIRKHTDSALAHVIVIDNDSQDESLDYLRSLDWIELIERKPIPHESPALSHSRALDLALERVRSPYVLSIHTDTLVRNNKWLPFLLNEIKRDTTIAGVGSWKLEEKPFHKYILKFLERIAQKIYYGIIQKKNHALEGLDHNHYYLRSHCALYRMDLIRKYQLTFSDQAEVAGKAMHRKLINQQYKMVFIASSVLLKYMDHINHATTVLNPSLSRNEKSITKGMRRIRKSLESFNATAVLQNSSLDKQMRKSILIFGHGYQTQFIDISNQYTKLFDPALYDVTVAYLTGEPDEAIKQRHITENVLFLNQSKSSIRGLKISAIKKMLAMQREKNFQIVICHRYKPSYIMLWVAQFCKIPALFFVMHELKTLSSIPRKLIVAALMRKNMYFAGVSNAVRNDIRHDIWGVPAERVITLYNMIDIELTQPAFLDRTQARAQLNLTDDSFVFGTLGRLVKAKDQKTLIQAFSLIKARCPSAKLVIMGEGVLEEELREQIKQLNLEKEIILTGFVQQGFCLLKAFDVFVLTSIKEAFGRVLLEAMIAKVPIIATKVNGIPEVLAESGILIDAQDPVQLAEKMLAFYHLSKNELEIWADKGERRAMQNFSMQRFNEIFWELPTIRVLI